MREHLVAVDRARGSTWVSAGMGLLSIWTSARTSTHRRVDDGACIRSTTPPATQSTASRTALTIARALDEPCEITHTPSTPSSTAPPIVSGSR